MFTAGCEGSPSAAWEEEMVGVVPGCSPAPEPWDGVSSWPVCIVDPRVGWVVISDADVPTSFLSFNPLTGGKLAFPQAAPRVLALCLPCLAGQPQWDGLGRPSRADPQHPQWGTGNMTGAAPGREADVRGGQCLAVCSWAVARSDSSSVPAAVAAAQCQQEWGGGRKSPFSPQRPAAWLDPGWGAGCRGLRAAWGNAAGVKSPGVLLCCTVRPHAVGKGGGSWLKSWVRRAVHLLPCFARLCASVFPAFPQHLGCLLGLRAIPALLQC